MAEAKEKKVHARDVFYKEMAEILMDAYGLDHVGKTKDGLIFKREDKDYAVRIIEKKEAVNREDFVEIFSVDAEEEEDFEDVTEEVAV